MDPNATTEVTYVLLNESNAEGAIECMARAFLRENQSIAMNVTYEDMMVANRLYLPTLLKENITLVAMMGDQVAGVCFNDDVAYLDEIADTLQGQPKCFDAIDALVAQQMDFFKNRILGELRAEAVAKGKDPAKVTIEKGKYLHLSLVGVDEKFARRGIATNLIRKTCELGKARGYTLACAEAAGPYSQRIFQNLGFDVWVQYRYADFEYHGYHPFVSVSDCTHTKLVVKPLENEGPLSLDN